MPLPIVRRGSDSVAIWRRAQMVLLSAQCVDVAPIAEVAFTSADRLRDMLHNFTNDEPSRCIRNTPAGAADIHRRAT